MAKSEHPFDQIIKEKLETFSPQDLPEWNFMQQKINIAENDLLFDQKIKQALEDLKVDSPEIQWESFLAKKNRQLARRNKIITARVIESCLILLLLWTIDNIGITNLINPSNFKDSNLSPLAELNSGSMLQEVNVLLQSENSKNSNIIDNLSQAQINNETKEKGFNRKKVNSAFSFDENTLHKKLRKPPFIDPLSRHPFTSDGFEKEVTPKSIVSNRSIPSLIQDDDGANDMQTTSSQIASIKNFLSEDKSINTLARNLNEILIDETKLNLRNKIPTTISAIKPVQTGKFTLLNIHTGLMMNIILSTPINANVTTKYFTQLQPGFQTVVNIGFRTNKYMVASGLGYQFLNYEPNLTERIYITEDGFTKGFYTLRFNKIKTQIINIPVLLHIDIIQRPSWTISSKAGLSLSAALKNDFVLDTFGTYYYSNSNPSIHGGVKPEGESIITSRINDATTQGILDGGNFGINSFTNLVLGIRYQKRLKSNLSFYTELEFTKMLGSIGFGPNGDRFMSGNINTGISYRL